VYDAFADLWGRWAHGVGGLVVWWNAERLHTADGDLPPVESEAAYRQRQVTIEAA
jgi:hypothetical protein